MNTTFSRDAEHDRLLSLTPIGRQALARRRQQEAAAAPAHFAAVPHLAAANQARADGAQDGVTHYHMGRPAPDAIMLDIMTRAAQKVNQKGTPSDAEQSAYTSAWPTAFTNAYTAAKKAGRPLGPDGVPDPEVRRKLLNSTPIGRQVLAREAKG